ncbi:hypothetical protein, partial [Chitinimonas sp. BJB300]|uniref:hypothetical protein n=1 Tax=Chitinimonas sp. BJB300 TaxID=1559339 RepID=UPI001E4F664D
SERGGNASFPTSAIASTIRTPCLPELRAAVEHDPYRASGLVLGLGVASQILLPLGRLAKGSMPEVSAVGIPVL